MNKKNVRYNIVITITYIIGIIIIMQLFNLQIIHGKEYLEQANSRLTRETTIKAARGNILDRNGNIIAGNTFGYTLNLYKSKIETETLNNTILYTLQILEKNGDTYVDKFPINIEPYEYKLTNITNWLEKMDMNKSLTPEEAFEAFVKEYELENYSKQDARKIMAVRYGIENEGYSSMKSYVISYNISEKSAHEFEEQKLKLAGIAVEFEPIRYYKYGSLASHILRIYRKNKRRRIQ